jgi:transcriptional regulator with XRE-family HTH domain
MLMPVGNQQEPTTRLDIERAVGARVREMRRARGISQAQLGQAMGTLGYPMEQPTVYKLENGTRPLRLNEVAALAAVFEVDVMDLLSADFDEEERRKALHELLDSNQRRGRLEEALDEAKDRLTAAQQEVDRLRVQLHDETAAYTKASIRFNQLQGEAQSRGK